MQLSIQARFSPTFNIGDLPFETVAAIRDRVFFCWRLVTSCSESRAICLRSMTYSGHECLFEMAYFLFKISDFLFENGLVEDINF